MNKTFLLILQEMGILAEGETIDTKVITFYITSARNFVKWYVNREDYTDDTLDEKFENQIINIAIYLYNNRKNKNIKSKTQGSRSVTYGDISVPEEYVKALPRHGRYF